jgi:hypothetical protein
MHAEPTTFRDTPCIHLHAEGASALVALHGAHVLSWIPADGREHLFLSDRAIVRRTGRDPRRHPADIPAVRRTRIAAQARLRPHRTVDIP